MSKILTYQRWIKVTAFVLVMSLLWATTLSFCCMWVLDIRQDNIVLSSPLDTEPSEELLEDHKKINDRTKSDLSKWQIHLYASGGIMPWSKDLQSLFHPESTTPPPEFSTFCS